MNKAEKQIGMEWLHHTAQHVLESELKSLKVGFSRIAEATDPISALKEFGYITEKLESLDLEFRIIKNKYDVFFGSDLRGIR